MINGLGDQGRDAGLGVLGKVALAPPENRSDGIYSSGHGLWPLVVGTALRSCPPHSAPDLPPLPLIPSYTNNR